LRQGLNEQFHIAGEQRPQHQAGGELAALAQMAHERPNFMARRNRGQDDRRLLARLLGHALRAIFLQPCARGDKAGERLRKLGDQPLARRRGQIVAGQHRFANGAEMTEALHDPVERERRNLGARVLDENQAGLGRADFRDRRRYGARQRHATRNGELRLRPEGRDRVDQVGVDQER
jgi:hypothetical protein